MTNTIFAFFMFAVLAYAAGLPGANRGFRTFLWVTVSLFAFGQLGHLTALGVFGLLIIQAVIVASQKFLGWKQFRLFPLFYAATLITLNAVLKWNIPGFSYLVLSSSIDLWRGQEEKIGAGGRFLNLFAFPKTAVGPITSFLDHQAAPPETDRIFRVAFGGILKAYILVNLWRHFVPAPDWQQLAGIGDYFWYGLWNYVNLYLEFSGACDLVAATFWLFGYGCPLNFNRPYLSLSVSEFWKRWHITLGSWIRNFVYIPLGGSRVSRPRVLFNLTTAMVICGLWHGLSWNYLAWGAAQGLCLSVERVLGVEQRLQNATRYQRAAAWIITQSVITMTMAIFFGKF